MEDLRERVMMKKKEIILDSDSAKDCAQLLSREIDNTADFLLQRERLLRKNPSEAIIKLKNELEPIFKKEFEQILVPYLFVAFQRRTFFWEQETRSIGGTYQIERDDGKRWHRRTRAIGIRLPFAYVGVVL